MDELQLENLINKWGGLTEEYKFYNDSVTLRFDKQAHDYLRVVGEDLILVDGVTTIVHILDKSNALIPWAVKQVVNKIFKTVPKDLNIPYSRFEQLILEAKSAHKEKLDEAADIGHQAHNWIEGFIKWQLSNPPEGNVYTQPYPLNEKVKSCVDAALIWMSKHNVRWLDTERKIYSLAYNYAGTMDGRALVDSCENKNCCPNGFKDRHSLIDWKSSNGLYVEFLLQTAAYEHAFEEETGENIVDRWVVQLGKESGEFTPWHTDSESFDDDFNGFLFCLNLTRIVAKIKARMKFQQSKFKEEQKQQLKIEKEKRLAIKCKSADKYKGIRYPTCNNGNPCETCVQKYKEKHGEVV